MVGTRVTGSQTLLATTGETRRPHLTAGLSTT